VARPPSETRQRIQDVARELFTQKGVQRTSLQDIANRLGITKPALYYHFRSREELVRSILQPLIDEGENFVAEHERRRGSARATPHQLLEGYFDFHYRHRADLVLVVEELTTLADLGLIDTMLAWRERLCRLVFGRRPTLRQSARAVIAFGGLQDCCLQFPDASYEQLRTATVDGAMAALGV
jgi:AcrR family transcriptional regulator